MRYLPHTKNDISKMLSFINKPNIKSLFNSIPEKVKLKKKLNIPKGICELNLKKELLKKSSFNCKLSFLGAGAVSHFVPEIVSQLLLRSEWYTSYTPYQPEISQGTLQAMFEFQTIIANIFGCDIANSSVYDGSTALVEACLMAKRIKSKADIVLLSRSIHPEYREVCATYLNAANIKIIEINIDENGCTDINDLENLLSKNIDSIIAIAYQIPNFFGQLEDQRKLIKLAHIYNTLIISVNTDPLAFGIIESPAFIGADIVVGEGISFCGHLNLGAPGLGLFACSKKYIRQMPGRLVGKTIDSKNNQGFVLTLSTREQHIRRERATSNICTNHNLMALAFSITISLYGKKGFYDLAVKNIKQAMFFRKEAINAGLKIKFKGPHFNESVIVFSSQKQLEEKLNKLSNKKIFAGCSLFRWYPEFNGCLLVTTTELHNIIDINELIKGLL